jgi:DNA replication protein DnaC
LDDLGREYKTAFSIDIVFEVLDFRYFNWKRTLTTTNHTMEELATIFGEPMRSRLMDTNRSRFVNMTGKDIRRFGA